MRRIGFAILIVMLGGMLAGFVSAEQRRNMQKSPEELERLACDQLWYLREKIRADGGICPRGEREQRAFFRNRRCLSPDEGILAAQVRDYLAAVRQVEAMKGCQPG